MKLDNISKLKYENLINYRICETMYIQMKKTNYNTFSNLCANLRDAISTKTPLKGAQRKVIVHTLNDMRELYELNHQESIQYINNFLNNQLWEYYQDIVVTFYNKTKTSYQ